MPVETTIASWSDVIQSSLQEVWIQVAGFIPQLIGALLVFVVGLIIAPILGGITTRVVRLLRVDALIEDTRFTEMMENNGISFSFASLIGKIVKWFFIIVFLIAAADILQWEQVTLFLNQVVLYIPNVFIAIIILALGLIAGKFVYNIVVASLSAAEGVPTRPRTLGAIARSAVIVFSVLAALIQLGIARELIEILFAGLVLALALAFGLGGREKAAELLRRIK